MQYASCMSIFGAILDGNTPASFVYRDAQCAAFLDISPMSHGHTLVIPTRACVKLDELAAEERAHLLEVAQAVGAAQRAGLDSKAHHLLLNDGKDASQSVPHVHFHVIPRYGGDMAKVISRMIWHVATLPVPRPETAARRKRLDAVAAKIAAHMPERVGP